MNTQPVLGGMFDDNARENFRREIGRTHRAPATPTSSTPTNDRTLVERRAIECFERLGPLTDDEFVAEYRRAFNKTAMADALRRLRADLVQTGELRAVPTLGDSTAAPKWALVDEPTTEAR